MQPFLTIWTNIRGTVREVIDNSSIVMCLVYICIGSIGSALSGIQDSGIDEFLPIGVVLLLSIILTPIFMIISQFVYSGIIFLIGKLFKGTGTFYDIFKGLSVSYIPYVILIPIFLIWFLIDPTGFITTQDEFSISTGVIVSTIIILIISIYVMVIQVIAISEAHQFSIGKAIGTFIIPIAVLFLLVFVFIIIIFVIIGGIMGISNV